ncbi:MAG: FkbM family methyltransferase [Candidatus Aminicenantes bacterium]|nr:FkbM family methyltransferase [Candidatus Aminicenantes bacterium]
MVVIRRLIKTLVPRKVIDLGWKMVTFFAAQYYSLIFKPLIIRRNTTDYKVFRDVFLYNEFKLPIHINPKFIIDAGAYTGLSTLYYSLKYPQAKIAAIEPDASNFEILKKHTEKLPNIIRIKAGVWHKNAFLKFVDKNVEEWSFQVEEVSGFEKYDVEAVTIDAVLKKAGFDRIDILKLDIEGSEKELFSGNYDVWMDKVNIIVIELHDKKKNGCTESFYSAVDEAKWKEYREREKVILVRKEFMETKG